MKAEPDALKSRDPQRRWPLVNPYHRHAARVVIEARLMRESPAEVVAALDGCLVWRAEMLGHRNLMEYVIEHPNLPAVQDADDLPCYTIGMSSRVDPISEQTHFFRTEFLKVGP